MSTKSRNEMEPKFWVSPRVLRGALTGPLSFAIVGHSIISTEGTQASSPQAEGRTRQLKFHASSSPWLMPTLHAYGLSDDSSELRGTIKFALHTDHVPWSHGTSKARREAGTEGDGWSGLGVEGSVMVSLELQPVLECGRCGEAFREHLSSTDQLSFGTEDSSTTGSYSAGDDHDEASPSLPIAALDVIEPDPRGIALDMLLVDAITCVIPDTPRCPDCTALSRAEEEGPPLSHNH